MKRKAQVKEIQEFIDELNDTLVIVEGTKDKKVLEKLGVKNILMISGRPIAAVAEQVAGRDNVVILTDFDKDGEDMADMLEKLLQVENINTRLDLRKKFRSISKITKIEELVNIADVVCNNLVAEYERNTRRNLAKPAANFHE